MTSRVLADIANGSLRSQYRLRFQNMDSNDNGTPNFAAIEDAEGSQSSGNVPQLVIRYTLP